MSRRLFYVLTAILVAVTVYMISRNLDKLPDDRTKASRNYIKEGKQADVKGTNPLLFKLRRKNYLALQMLAKNCFPLNWEEKITSLFKCWLKIAFP